MKLGMLTAAMKSFQGNWKKKDFSVFDNDYLDAQSSRCSVCSLLSILCFIPCYWKLSKNSCKSKKCLRVDFGLLSGLKPQWLFPPLASSSLLCMLFVACFVSRLCNVYSILYLTVLLFREEDYKIFSYGNEIYSHNSTGL